MAAAATWRRGAPLGALFAALLAFAAATGDDGPSRSVLPLAPEAPSKGHVFILNTDIRFLACDAWLLPVARSMEIDRVWHLPASSRPPRPNGWGTTVHVAKCVMNTEELRQRRQQNYRNYDQPLPILTDVISDGSSGKKTIEDLLVALRQFLAVAAASVSASRFGRALPLIALPIFGSGLAADELLGQGDESHLGALIGRVLDDLHDFARKHPIDVALCTIDNAAFGAALHARRKRSAEFIARAPAHACHRDMYHEEVIRLAQLFLAGQVSLFLGAGVSINAGLPSWAQLLDQLATDVGFDVSGRDAVRNLDPLEAAQVCASRAGGDPALKFLVSQIIGRAKRHSLQHALLAGLPFRGCITTNYDQLFEQAVRCAGGDIAVLPTQIGGVRDMWLLKLHGDVERPESIVLTRSDYQRFSKDQAACEGVLQGLLLTQHVLFVGFGMRDENWCRIIATVKAPFHSNDPVGLGAVHSAARMARKSVASAKAGGVGGNGAYAYNGHRGGGGGGVGHHRGRHSHSTRGPHDHQRQCNDRLHQRHHGPHQRGGGQDQHRQHANDAQSSGSAHAGAAGDSSSCSSSSNVHTGAASVSEPASALARATAGDQVLDDGDPVMDEGSLLGTVLSLQRDLVLDSLWEDILHVTPMDTIAPARPEEAHLPSEMAWHARSLEIFLDHVVSAVESRRCRILLNPKFTTLLSRRTQTLKSALEDFLDTLPVEAKQSGAFKPLLTLLLFMGLRTEALRTLVDDKTLEGPYHRRISKLADKLPYHVRAYRDAVKRTLKGSMTGRRA